MLRKLTISTSLIDFLETGSKFGYFKKDSLRIISKENLVEDFLNPLLPGVH